MSKKKPRLAQEEKRKIHGRTISDEAFEVTDGKGSTDHLPPVFTFVDTCNSHFLLEDWQGDELRSLISTLKDLGRMTWREIQQLKGFKIVDQTTFSKELPRNISPDVTIYECRVSKRARIFGHRSKNQYNIVWFDRNHEVYPMS